MRKLRRLQPQNHPLRLQLEHWRRLMQ